MKTLSKLFLASLLITVIAAGCKKTLSDNSIESESGSFNSTTVKEWYYGSFKKTPEWTFANKQAPKIPDWKNGVSTKYGKNEAVEFPLAKGKSGFSIPGSAGLTSAQCAKIANASISKVVFIDNGNNKILVRVIDYIPDWQYLESKQFKIGSLSTKKEKDEFTGRKVIKTWGGDIIMTAQVIKGKVVKTGLKNVTNTIQSPTPSTATSENCVTEEFCVWQEDCTLTIYGDGYVIAECGGWYNTGECWTETICSGGEEEEGGGGGIEVCNPTLVSPEEQEFLEYSQGEVAPVNITADISNSQTDPITGTITWTVTKGAVAGWKVEAVTEYKYHHDKFYTVNNTVEHTYDLFHYKTISTAYTGSNTYITSTWTHTNATSATMDQVFNNNTSSCYGKSNVIGTIRHVANFSWPIPLPFCPKVLDVTDPVSNTLTFTPR